MLILSRIYIKYICRQFPLLILLVSFQLVLGRLSVSALNRNPPDLKIAVTAESPDELTERLIGALRDIPALEIVTAESESAREDHSLLGLLVLPDYFSEYIINGRNNAALFYPAPGVADTSEAETYITAELASMRAEILLERRLESLGAADMVLPADLRAEKPILSVEYTGPPIVESPFTYAPAYGVPALFVLLAFLHAAQTAPGPDNRRMASRGGSAIKRCFISCLPALWAVWCLDAVLYGLGMRFFYNMDVPPPIIMALACLGMYASALGCLLALAGARRMAAGVFVPWFLLAMTMGGGLWNTPVKSVFLTPLLPTSLVSASNGGDWRGAVSLLACAAAAAGLCGVWLKRMGLKARRG
ncbi:MAG: hypothetical protein LBS84_07220 [Clostridiales bacterium]|nr:hypothetical protein [Clostridiales bacterium]